MSRTVSGMVLLISVLAGAAAVAGLIAVLIREGFRHGDLPVDVRVRARTLPAADPGAGGRWVQVTVSNPAAAIALVALGLRRGRRGWPATPARRTGGRRTRLGLGERSVGAVPAGQDADFHLWAEGELRRLRLMVAVGTPGRLRLHRLPLPAPVGDAAAGVGVKRPDSREPVRP